MGDFHAYLATQETADEVDGGAGRTAKQVRRSGGTYTDMLVDTGDGTSLG